MLPVTTQTQQFHDKARRGEKLVVLTAYDAPSAELVAASGVDAILVGDSVANTVLGLPRTRDLSLDAMRHHLQAVARGAPGFHIIADLPHAASQSPEDALNAAKQLIADGACAVKIEEHRLEHIRQITASGFDIWAHLGFTPQTIDKPALQATTDEEADQLLTKANDLQDAGAVALVLELIPEGVAQRVTDALTIPTIGIGAGSFTSGQVQVWHDLLGLTPIKFRHAARFAELRNETAKALARYVEAVRSGTFPAAENVSRRKETT